jgi:hypothetical protein
LSGDPTHEFSLPKFVKQTLDDPMVKLLIKGSNLTLVQFQTFLIDYIVSQKGLQMNENSGKMYSRVDKTLVSRGAFNRTLAQATRNIIQSIYTVFLLGYVEIFDTPTLEPFIETSNELRSYVDRLRVSMQGEDVEQEEALATLAQELQNTIGNLVRLRRLRPL